MFTKNQPAFSAGELGDQLLTRADVQRYQLGLRRARNVLLATAGGFYNRTGTRYCGEVHTGEKARLVPFQFTVDQGVALELSEGRIRFVTNGGYILRKELIVTSIIPNPAADDETLVQTDGPHGYEVGDDVYFDGIAGMVEINGLTLPVVSTGIPDAEHFAVKLDSRSFGAFTGSTGGVAGDVLGGEGGYPPPPSPPSPPPNTAPELDPPPPFDDTAGSVPSAPPVGEPYYGYTPDQVWSDGLINLP